MQELLCHFTGDGHDIVVDPCDVIWPGQQSCSLPCPMPLTHLLLHTYSYTPTLTHLLLHTYSYPHTQAYIDCTQDSHCLHGSNKDVQCCTIHGMSSSVCRADCPTQPHRIHYSASDVPKLYLADACPSPHPIEQRDGQGRSEAQTRLTVGQYLCV